MSKKRNRIGNLKYVLPIIESPKQSQSLVIYNGINIFVYCLNK